MSAALVEYESEVGSILGKFRASRPRVETYSYVVTRQTMLATAVLPLFSFTYQDIERRLRRPLMLRVVTEDGEIFVENDGLRIFGRGGTLQAAVQSFAHDLAYYWVYYRSLRTEDVAGDAVRLKSLYEELVA